MTQATFNADYFRMAAKCASTEDTRYYLNGVYVEPVEHINGNRGVLLVATDGHRLVCINDPDGTADKPHLIRADKDFLKACKTPKKSNQPRVVKINDDQDQAIVHDEDNPVAIMCNAHIDGTFPDWRRIVPDTSQATGTDGAFNAAYIHCFGEISRELADTPFVKLISMDAGSAATVYLAENAFGVLMPVRRVTSGMPEFWQSPQATSKAA